MKIRVTKSMYKLNSGGDQATLGELPQLLERFVLLYQWLFFV